MFCQNCGNQIADEARFCNRCGAQVAVIPQQPQVQSIPVQPAAPVNTYNPNPAYNPYPQQTVYVIKETKAEMDPQQKAKIVKVVMALISALLMDLALIITFFKEVVSFDSYQKIKGSLVDIIENEFVMEYAFEEIGSSVSIAFILLLVVAVLANGALPGMAKDLSMSKWALIAAEVFYLAGFFVLAFNEYVEPNGTFVFMMILFGIGASIGAIQSDVRIPGTGKSLGKTGRTLIGADPKRIKVSVAYEGDYPEMEKFEELVEKTGLREHLLKTHPNNQFFITLQQLMLQKYYEMVKSNYHTNRRVFDYTDENNKVYFVMSFDERRVFECEINLNMT